ncbi:MAG: tetratricopeptide repeat protein [Anaerolineaceae bacterium]|nr:MAG: tetratricopeptide repeat protein [Anaerolineaceae bacterium]
MEKEPHQLAEEGKRAFAAARYAEAAHLFEEASRGYTLGRDRLHAAEMDNNHSVALLKNNQPQQALDAAAGTDQIFESHADVTKQAMAFGNQAAALDALKRYDEALMLYERAAELFDKMGEKDMRALVLKSAAAIRLKQGKLSEAGMEMLGSLGAVEKPSLWQRFLKFLLRFKP